jgi:hypothetical protein
MNRKYFGYEFENVAETTDTGEAAKQRVDAIQSPVATQRDLH